MATKKLILTALQSICFAESKENLALGFANRSAVYLEDGKYDECLQNIKIARDGYPEERIEKLNKREAKCRKLKKENATKPSNVPDKFYQLSYPPNPKVPFVVDRLENRKGNLFATEDLKPGDIIAVEDSVIKFLPRYGYVDHCYYCFRVNHMNLLPCLKSASLMFCSKECRNQPYDIRDEPDIAGVKNVVRQALDVFGQKGFENEIYSGGNRWILYKSPTFFDFDLSKDNPDRLKNWWQCTINYNNLLGFVNPEEIRFPPIFGNNHALNTFNDSFKFSTSVWMRCQALKDDQKPIYTEQFLSLYGLTHMIPHSCLYNIEYYKLDDNKLVYYVTKPIKAGEQLFRNHL
jgi:SET domain